MMNCKHVRVREDKVAFFLSHIKVMFPESVSYIERISPRTAFPVEKMDKDPVTGKNRLHLIKNGGNDVFGWVFEDYMETI